MAIIVPAVPFGQGPVGRVHHARSLVEMADNAQSAGEREAAELLIARAYAAYDLAATFPLAGARQSPGRSPPDAGMRSHDQDEMPA